MDSEQPQDLSKLPVTSLISLAEASKLSGLSPHHVRKLVREKTVWGIKLGRNWFTTEDAMRAYLATDRRTGPKKKK